MKKIPAFLVMLALLVPFSGTARSAIGQYWPKGYIDRVDFIKMEVTVDGEVISISPGTQVSVFNKRQTSIIDLDKGQFASVSGMKKGSQVTAIRIDIVNPRLVKSMTSSIAETQKDSVLLGNGFRVTLENGFKMNGIAELKPSMMVRIRGFTDKKSFRVWKIEPMHPDNPSLEINGKLTSISTERLVVDGSTAILRDSNETFIDESYKPITTDELEIGKNIKVTCSSNGGMLSTISTQKMNTIKLTFSVGSDVARLNGRDFKLSCEVASDGSTIWVPSLALLEYCGVKTSFSKDKNLLMAVFDGQTTVVDFKKGIATRNGIEHSFGKHRLSCRIETYLSIYAFMLCLGVQENYTFPGELRSHTMIRH